MQVKWNTLIMSITMICWSRDVLSRRAHNFYYVAANQLVKATRGIMTENLSHYSPWSIMVHTL
jgi:hypothetical protein